MNGKQFEQKLKQSCEEQGVLFVRLRDAGYQGVNNSSDKKRFTVKNIADCIFFNDTIFTVCELKRRQQSLAFKDITQFKDLSKVDDVISANGMKNARVGLLVCFADINNVWWVSVNGVNELFKRTGKKSFNNKDCIQHSTELPKDIYKVNTLVPKGKRVERIDVSFVNNIE